MTSRIIENADQNWSIPDYQTPLWLDRSQDYCVIIPVINEGTRIRNLLTKMDTLKIGEIADIIIVDGGSTDGSLSSELLEKTKVRGMLIKTGPGKLSAQLRCAYSFAIHQGYEGIVTIDGNDKDDPEAIPRFIDSLKKGFDFVQASRYISKGIAENTPKSRHFAIKYVHAPILSLFSGFHWTDTTQGFRAYSKRLLMDEHVAPFREIFVTYELLAYFSYRVPKLGYRCIELPTTRRYPKGETPTKISGIKGNWLVLKIMINACLGKYNPSRNGA